jgi:hypothetical protein
VIGILVALQINDWNDARVRHGREREYIASMLGDLQGDLKQIDSVVAGNRILLDGLDSLLTLLSRPRPDAAYRRGLYLQSLVYTYWYITANFPELTMTQLKSSGDLQLIRDNDVKLALLGYEQAVDFGRQSYDEDVIYFHTFEATQKQIFNFTLAKRSFEYIEQDNLRILEPVDVYDRMVPEGDYLIDDDPALLARYYGDILFHRTALNNTVLALLEQRRAAESLIKLLRERYPGVGPPGVG